MQIKLLETRETDWRGEIIQRWPPELHASEIAELEKSLNRKNRRNKFLNERVIKPLNRLLSNKD